MGKRFWSLALSVALIGGVFSVLPATAQEASPIVIPPVVQIDDPVGDANGLNDQDNAYGTPLEGQGDVGGPAGGTATDIRKVWFSNTPTEVSLHIQLNGDPSTLAYDTYYRFSSNAGSGTVAADETRGCLQWIASVNGTAGAYNGATEGNLTDKCNVGTPVTGPLVISPAAEGFVITVTFPRSYSPLLANDLKLTAPFGVSRVLYADGLPPSPAAGSTAAFVTLDNTKRGSDYTLTSAGPVVGGPGKPAKPTPPGKNDPPGKGKKNGCSKGKGEKKGACPGKKPPKPKPPVASCAPYTPGEEGAEAGPAVLVTDAATAEKPVETTIDITEGIGVGGVFEDAMSHAFKNVQVDSTSASKGLYVRLEMPAYADYDLYINNPDGSTAARAAGFNPAPAVYNDTEMGGHTEEGAEMIDGLETADCQGYTVKTSAASGEGGELTLKFWLGDAGYTATAGQQTAADMFFGAAKMRNPMARSVDSSDSAQASGTPAATKGCKKGKGKKKGCKKPPVASCAAFVPGEAGTDKPLVTVTDTATAEAPVEQKVNLEMSVGDLDQTGMVDHGSADFFNVQVDTANPDAGLYVLFEFPTRRDYDLNLLHTDGSYAARSRRWNTFSETTDALPFNVSSTGYGGEGTDTTELLAGIRTADCGGWTVGAENWLGEGGEFTIKMWLGEAKYDPQAPGTETP